MKRKLRKCLFRGISIAMAFCMTLTMLPQTALAHMADLMDNSREENEGILDELARLAGGDSEAARELLESLGLLDENGELVTDQTILLDGEELSLDEVMDILEDENTDLSRIADVDGTPVALGDLKTMIEIEKELIRLKETYFSDRVFEGEAVDNLNDLLEQLQGEGITMHADSEPQADNATGTGEDVTRASNGNGVHVVDMNGLKSISIKPSGSKEEEKNYESFSAESGEFDLKAGETVSMDLEYDKGLLGEYISSVKVELGTDTSKLTGDTPPILTSSAVSETLTYTNKGADLSGLKLFITVEIDNSKIGTVNKYSFKDVTAALKITNATGLAFYKDNSYRDSHNIMLRVDLNNIKRIGTEGTITTSSKVEDSDGNLNLRIGVNNDNGELYESFKDFNALIDVLQQKNNTQSWTADDLEKKKNLVSYDVDMYIKLTCDEPTINDPYRIIRFYAKPDKTTEFEFGKFINREGGNYPGTDVVHTDNRKVAVSIRNGGSETQYKYEAGCKKSTDGLYIPPYMSIISAWYKPNTNTKKDYTATVRCVASIKDGGEITPDVTFSIPANTYASGSLVPITMDFNTFVKVTENASININGVDCLASELSIDNAFGDKIIAWYPVKDIDGTEIIITSLTGFTDIFGKSIKKGDEFVFNDANVILDTVRIKDCLTSFELTCEEVGESNDPGGVSSKIGYEIVVRQEEQYGNVYSSYKDGTGNDDPNYKYAPFKVVIEKEKEDGSKEELVLRPIFAADPNDRDKLIIQMKAEDENKIKITFRKDKQKVKATLYMNSGTEAEPQWEAVPYYYSVREYEVRERKNVTNVKVNPETGEHADQVITLGDEWTPTLSARISPEDADCITGKWSSNQEDIATIDPDTGKVTPKGTKLGEVTFTFTADNGTTDETDDIKGTSLPYRVIAGKGYSLSVPNSASTILALTGTNATVHWSSNVLVKSPDTYDFKYKVELFKGNYADADALKDAYENDNTILVDTFEAKKDSMKQEIPSSDLTEISDSRNTPVYTVRISTPNPTAVNDRKEDLIAIAHIVMLSKPGVAKLVRPEKIYLTDDVKSASVNWKVEEGTGSTGKATLKITKDSIPVTGLEGDDDQDGVVELTGTEGTCSFTIDKVDLNGSSPKDIYQIVLSVDNTGTWSEVPSVDSYPLYVYGKDALRIADSEGKEISSLALDNHAKVSGKLPTDTDSILKLREELGLIDYIGINYEKYQWSSFYDGIKWAIDKDDISLNYKQGGLYENIKNFSYETYLPKTKFALSSTVDANNVTLTATHAATGMNTSIQVSSRTLKDQFFLFQVTPALKTEICYTNKKGERRSVFTNEDGVLALYEPDGIASDLELSSQDGKNVYMGTMLKETLHSGERDATLLQLYPLNTFKLRLAARAEVTLVQPDGMPLKNETVTLRGGVYKNGFYCQDAKLGNTKDADSLKDGKTDTSYKTDENGKLTVYMDSMQFYSTENGESKDNVVITPKDRLEYILEVRDIAKDKYYPLFLTINGQMGVDEVMRSGASVVKLEEAPAGGAKPYVAVQAVSHPIDGDDTELDVKGFTGRIGPNSSFPTAVLHSVVLLWGIDGSDQSDFKLEIADQNGYVPESAQKSEVKKYPFSYIPLVENYLTLSDKTMSESGWVEERKDMGLKSRLYKDGNLLQEQILPFRIVDMTKLKKVTEDEKVKYACMEMASASIIQNDVEYGDLGDSNILKLLTGQLGELQGPIDQTTFKLLITPGEDASVFKAMIWAGYNSLGLDDVEYQDGVALGGSALAQSLEIGVPGVGDLTGMAKGEYDPKAEAKETKANGKDGDRELKLQLEGYYEAEIRYNFEEDKWEIFTTGGGFTAGIGLSWTFSVNTFAGPVPVTGSFEVGGAVQLSFKTAVRYGQQGAGLEWADPDEKCVNDFLTSLRFNGYVHAFGGVGFDYSVVALKVGLFGNIDINNENKFLSRTYLKDGYKRQLNGQAFNITGEVGIKFVAQFLFIQYECVLLSGKAGYTETWNDFHAIGEYWDNATSGLSSETINKIAEDDNFEVVSASATLQSREYLEEYARTWSASGNRSALPEGLVLLQENANPGSYPKVSASSNVLGFISDNESSSIYDSRAYYSYLDKGSYSKPVAIPDPDGFQGYGDSSLSLAGTARFNVAAWVRESEAIPGKDSGDSMTPEEQNLMMNGTEIVASLGYNGGWVSTTRLTDNATPDIAPVAVVNGNDYYNHILPIKAYVFWRSTYSASEFGEKDLLEFATRDCIMYSYAEYGAANAWSTWSEPKMLYNGMNGSVKALSAAVSPHYGVPIAVYTLDQGGKNDPKDYEIAYSIPDDYTNTIESMIITSDHNADENPQVIGVSDNDDDYFIIGWNSEKEGKKDIRFQKVYSRSCVMMDDFPESICSLTADGSNPVNGTFIFAGQNNTSLASTGGDNLEDYKDINNLTLVWNETLEEEAVEGVVTVGHDILKAAKLRADGDSYRLSAPVTVAELEERTQADSFSAYVSGENEVKAVIQATQYDTVNEERKMYAYNEESKKKEEISISLPKEKTNIYIATSHFEVDAAEIENIGVDYATVSANSLTPVQFEIKNTGINDLDGLTVTMAGGEEAVLNRKLIPNESVTLTVWHKTGSTLTDVDYSITANNGAVNEAGKVYLDYPDIGIADMEVIEENAGKRKILMTLYNAKDATLSGKKNREVKLDFYTDSLYKDGAVISSSTDGVTVAGNEITISGEEALGRIDAGAFTLEVTYDLGNYVNTKLKRDEVPESGIYLYVNAWTKGKIKNEIRCLPEYRTADNQGAVLLSSPLIRTGEIIQIEAEQGIDSEGNTTADVIVRNNSLKTQTTASMAAVLLGEEDNVLEIKPLSLSTSLAGESTNVEQIKFSKPGVRVSVIVADSGEDMLNFEGLPVRISDFVKDGENQYSYTLYGVIAKSTVVTAINGTNGKVAINGEEFTGIGSLKVNIPLNESKITVVLGDKTYTLNLSTKKKEYTITLDPNGGILSDITSIKRTNDDVYGPLPIPEWEGYVFDGWYTEASGGNKISDDTKVELSENTTLYAHWKEDVSGLTIAFANPGETYTYTGSQIRPQIIVKNNGIRLTEGVDYSVSYSNNINASSNKKAKITVKGKGNLADSVIEEFVIQPKNINDITKRDIVVAKNAKAVPTLYYAGKKLGSKDYKVTEAPNKQKYELNGTMKLEGKGNFTGELELPVTVVDKKDLKKIKVTPGNETLIYDGTGKKISFTVADAKTGEELKDTDYIVLYPDNITDAGKKKFTIIGLGNYTNEVTKEYTIKPYVIPEADIRIEGIKESGYDYIPSGVIIGKDLSVSYEKGSDTTKLTEGKDYKVTYKNNKKVGDNANCTVTFLNNYKGTKKQINKFKINPFILNGSIRGLKVIVADQLYSGKAGTYVSKPYVTLNGTILNSSCYNVTYYKDEAMTDEIKGKNKITLGSEETSATVYVKIAGKGNYASANSSDCLNATYQVRNDKNLVNLSKAKVKITFLDSEGNAIKNMMYTGKALEPTVKVEIKPAGSRDYVTVDPANYDVAYMNNKNKGTATVVVKGKGAGYTGSKTVAFKIAAKSILNWKFLKF